MIKLVEEPIFQVKYSASRKFLQIHFPNPTFLDVRTFRIQKFQKETNNIERSKWATNRFFLLLLSSRERYVANVVIGGIDRISLSTGMKLMAREWYGHARHPAKFHDSVMRREPFGARPPRFRYIPGITYRPFRRTSMSATQRIPCIWLRCNACIYIYVYVYVYTYYSNDIENTMGIDSQWWMPEQMSSSCVFLFMKGGGGWFVLVKLLVNWYWYLGAHNYIAWKLWRERNTAILLYNCCVDRDCYLMCSVSIHFQVTQVLEKDVWDTISNQT